jgi:uncharacterized repeat protein (TIGR03806 family)
MKLFKVGSQLGQICFLLIFFALAETSAFSQTAFLDFNAAGQYASNFNPWNDASGVNAGNYCFAEGASAGVNASGGVTVFQNTDTTATYNAGAWNFSTNGAVVVVSALIKANGLTSANKVQLGILNTSANGFYNNANVAFESFRFVPTSATVWSLREQFKTATAAPVEATLGTVNIIAGHWYKFLVGLTNTGGTLGNYTAGCAIYDYGTDGITPGANIITFSTSRSNTGQTSITIAPVWAGIRAYQNAGIDAWDNFLVYVPSSKPVFTLGLTNLSVATGAAATLKVLADGPGTISYAWFTNNTLVAGAANSTYTSPPLDSSYTNVMVVASNSNGSTTNSAVLTVSAPTVATLTNLPATSVAATSASLNGQVLDTGNDAPTVTIYYGTSDGGANPSAWANSVSVGVQSGAFSKTVIGLATNTTYYFRAKAVNVSGTSWASPSQTFTTLPVTVIASALTYHYDNSRAGQNTNELFLTPANVSANTFGKLFTYSVDGYLYAEPVYMPNVVINGQSHNVVIAASENNSVYAFDADSNAGPNGGLLWQTNLGIAEISINNYGVRYHHNVLNPLIGITSTPVIDPASGTIYVDTFTGVIANTNSGYHLLHALNITNGAERSYSPVLVNASVPGTGVDSSNGIVTFNPSQHMNRPAMTLAGGILYVSFGSYGDTDPYHGWVIGYNATNLTQLTNIVFCTTPNATTNNFGVNAAEGALWMGGGGLCVDENTNIYFEVGNGSFSAHTNGGDYGDSFVKLSTISNQLVAADYFAPSNQLSMDVTDNDLGSGGPILLPDSVGSAAHPHLIVGAGKEGTIYLVDRDSMGHYSTTTNQIVQTLPNVMGGIWGVPAYWNNRIYFQGAGDVLKAFWITNGVITTVPVTKTTASFSTFTTPSISANGLNNGIAWVIQVDAYNGGNGVTGGAGVLHAYNATNLTQELYNSNQNLSRDNPGAALKYAVPVVANGKVFVRGEYALSVYGLGTFLSPPIIAPAGGVFTNSVIVSITNSAASASIYYTLDGTTPTTNSILYTAPFILTNTALVQAIAAQPGSVNSAVASASFLNSSAVGNGTGLLGAYWSNTTSAAFTNIGFNATPTLVRTDSVVNFTWGIGSPAPTISTDSFVVRWTGSVQPQFSETYTFYTTSDDGARLWINDQLLVNRWVDQGATESSGTISLKAQQRYNIRMEYYDHTGNASAMLSWSSPSTTKSIIPQSQLYPVTNPPPAVVMMSPTNGSTYTAAASVTMSADADSQYNSLSQVDFYASDSLIGSVTNLPYTITATGLAAGNYTLTAVATDGSGLSSTSAPVNISVTAGSGAPYGLALLPIAPAFFNMPTSGAGSIPAKLSLTGVFGDTPNLAPSIGFIPYTVNVPLWSDAAVKTRWFSVPNNGAPYMPNEQIGFAPTGEWSFPAGTVFVKHFDLVTNEITGGKRRLETRLLVRDVTGSVYGQTYRWRADNSDADIITTGLNEDIVITSAAGTRTQTWYYPSPSDCLVCHTPVANYVLGVKTRQLNGNFTYASTGNTDNQLRALNRVGLFNPAFDEANISSFTKLASLTNSSATLEVRARSYLDANCAQCHRPDGPGPTFDGRYDIPLASQNITNVPAGIGTLGISDNAMIVMPKDIWRSVLYLRMNSTDNAIKMPPLARNLIDTNAVTVMRDWINSLPGTPALSPPTMAPNGGTFTNSVNVTLSSTNVGASLYYTLDGSLPTTNGLPYSSLIILTSNVTLRANAIESGYNNSVSLSATFSIFAVPPLRITGFGVNGPTLTLMAANGPTNGAAVLLSTTNVALPLNQWTRVVTNVFDSNGNLNLSTNVVSPADSRRFYRLQFQ